MRFISVIAAMVAGALCLASPSMAQSIDGLQPVASGKSVGKDLASGVRMVREEWSGAKDYGMVIAAAPHPVRDGDASLRVELRRGDCGKSAGWDDCLHGNERVELSSAKADWMKPNTKVRYGWSIYLPPDWNPKDLSQIVMGQFHQIDSHPAFQVFYQSQGGGLQVKCRVEETRNSVGTYVRTIIPEKELRGRWHDIRVEAYWRKKADGYFKVFVDDALAYDFKGRTMSADRVYFKLGIYRIGPPLVAPDLVVYYDNIWRK